MARHTIDTSLPHWQKLKIDLQALVHDFDAQQLDIVAFAKRYEHAAKTLLGATQSEGLSSMRFRCVVKALDLATPKSELLEFLNEH